MRQLHAVLFVKLLVFSFLFLFPPPLPHHLSTLSCYETVMPFPPSYLTFRVQRIVKPSVYLYLPPSVCNILVLSFPSDFFSFFYFVSYSSPYPLHVSFLLLPLRLSHLSFCVKPCVTIHRNRSEVSFGLRRSFVLPCLVDNILNILRLI